MRIYAIREFLYLAEARNFSCVAKSLFISQSALSKHIDAMETEIGSKLFVRDRHSVQLTDAGVLFQERMKLVIREYDAAIKEIKDAQKGIEKTLKVGYLYGACKDFVADACSKFEELFPQISLELYTIEVEEPIPMLEANQLDMAVLVKLPHNNYSTFNYIDLYDDCLSVVVSHRHSLAERPWATLDDLKDERVLVPNKEAQPNVHAFYRQAFKNSEIWDDADESLRDINSALPYLSANTGVAITFRHLKSYFDIDVNFLPLVGVDTSFPVAAVWKNASENETVLAFAECLKQAYAQKK
ncbi:MAG: LysR family transcriptional regulator [Coriobacteriia bacterium]|jgi:DNA-binding transcriptional LysR family regulator|nr:LysR family transcriptional regulator [Coriobacteriia bacterium]MDR2714970.1 LysR family transcriptional regulator [Coriobacteriales bacterium]